MPVDDHSSDRTPLFRARRSDDTLAVLKFVTGTAVKLVNSMVSSNDIFERPAEVPVVDDRAHTQVRPLALHRRELQRRKNESREKRERIALPDTIVHGVLFAVVPAYLDAAYRGGVKFTPHIGQRERDAVRNEHPVGEGVLEGVEVLVLVVAGED